MALAVVPNASLEEAEAVARVVELARGGMDVPSAARIVLDEGVTDEALRSFALRGLARTAHDFLGAARPETDGADALAVNENRGGPVRSGHLAAVRPHAAKEYWRRVLAAGSYQTADPKRRAPLILFTAEDCAALAARARAIAIGNMRLRKAMQLAMAAFTAHPEAATISALPEANQQQIGEALR